jgi:hypothetical protein
MSFNRNYFNMKKKQIMPILLFSILSVLLIWPHIAKSQDYRFHSLFIYNFTKYIEWPENKKSGDFVIGVLGKSDITENLVRMAEMKTVGEQKIQVSVVNDIAAISDCHILFLPQSESNKLDDVLDQANKGSVLVVSERNGLGKRGSAINFIIESGKWRFELNLSAFEKSNLKVSGELVKLGKVI